MEGLWAGDGEWEITGLADFANHDLQAVGASAQGGDGTAEPSRGTPTPSKAKGIPESSFISWQESQPEQARHSHREREATAGPQLTWKYPSPWNHLFLLLNHSQL